MYNFTGLKAIYRQAHLNKEPTVAFEVGYQIGRFVFMMFFSAEDDESKDKLFLYLGRTQVLLALKMYGSHRDGDFKVYFNARDESAIRKELDIQSGESNPFNIGNVFDHLNASIPQNYTLRESVQVIQGRQAELRPHLRQVVDEAKKIHLIGPVRLPAEKKPREKTLRKLYLYVQSPPNVIVQLIEALKGANWTLAWSETPPKEQRGLLDIINEINK